MMAQPVCKGCGQPIQGNYLAALDAYWHPEHFVCAGCGRPIQAGSLVPFQGRPYHIDCYSRTFASPCAYCGKPLVGEYFIDQWGTKFCKEHQNYPRCTYCGRLVPPSQEADVEVVRCAICRASAIETTEEARPIYRQLIQWVSSQGLRYNNLPLSLELSDRTRLAQYLQERSQTHSLGATMGLTYAQDGQIIRTEIKGIAVLSGLPSTLFQAVTLHELGHVWLIIHGIYHLPSWAEEGFCELLSYRYLSEINTPESNHYALGIERNTDPVYGEGFRRIRAIVAVQGMPHFITVLQTTKQLP